MDPTYDQSTDEDTIDGHASRLVVDRRSCLKLAGGLVATGAAGGAAVGAVSGAGAGYGYNGFGTGPYGTGDSVDLTDERSPTVDLLRAAETSPSDRHANIAVDWAVSAENRNLNAVEIDLIDANFSIDTATVSVSGASASGTTDFTVENGADLTYRIRLEATDATGKSTVARETVSN